MTPSLQARAFAGLLSLVPDRVIARTLANPPRRRWPALVPERLGVEFDIEVLQLRGGQVARARARHGVTGRHAFYLHGGAYTLRPMHWDAVRPLLARGWTVSMVDYPLAPEHTVEATVDMVLEAWRQASAHSAVPVDLMGDSAGGGLALVLLQRIRDLGLPGAGRTVLFSPWVDLVMNDPVTVAADRRDPLLPLSGLRAAAALYAGGRDLADPLLSPIHGNLERLGDLQVWVGTRELFLAQVIRLADLARSAEGTDLDLRIGEHMIHDWPMLPIPEGRRALADAIAFLSQSRDR